MQKNLNKKNVLVKNNIESEEFYMEILNKLGDIASKTYKKTSQKTGEIAKEAKIKMKMNENKSKINNLYLEMGKKIYQNYISKEKINMEEDIKNYCDQICELSNEIEKHQEEVLSIKNKRICENCYSEIDLKFKYCPNCGFEQSEEKIEDIEEVDANKEENDDQKSKENTEKENKEE